MPIIEIKDLTYVYQSGTPYEKKALEGLSFSIEAGEFVGIIGANGSGKSTLMQHFNGLLLPTAGSVLVKGKNTAVNHYYSELWKEVGLVFQFPEQQIFASTVFAEVAYGLKNLGLEQPDIERRVEEGLHRVGLNPEEITHLSPLRLSGGERRLLALASIMAMCPDVLVLDEPTAGLDPAASDRVWQALQDMQRDYKTTVIMVSHQADELILLANKLAFLEEGRLLAYGGKVEVLQQMARRDRDDWLLPDHLQLIYCLEDCGCQVNTDIISLEEAALEISRILKEPTRCKV